MKTDSSINTIRRGTDVQQKHIYKKTKEKINSDMLEFNIEWLVDLYSCILNGRGLSGLRNSNIKAELIIPLVWLYLKFITEKVTLLRGADLRFNSSLNSAAVAAQPWSYGGWLLLNAVTETQSRAFPSETLHFFVMPGGKARKKVSNCQHLHEMWIWMALTCLQRLSEWD